MQRFKSILDSFPSKYRISNIFDDFLLMSVAAFTKGQMEEQYLEAIARYDKNAQHKFGELLGALILDYDDTADNYDWQDHLGEWFMQYNPEASRMGQFFTPVSLCQMMAQMVQDEREEGLVNDCSAGSSRNLIAHCRLLPSNRFNFFYVAQDLDRRCVLMSVLNYIMFGMKGVVIHMNTLSMDVYGGYRIYMPETGLPVQPLTKEQCLGYITQKTQQNETDTQNTTNKTIQPGTQTQLF